MPSTSVCSLRDQDASPSSSVRCAICQWFFSSFACLGAAPLDSQRHTLSQVETGTYPAHPVVCAPLPHPPLVGPTPTHALQHLSSLPPFSAPACAVFRDDLVFLIYLYQRWIYRVDKKRTNEFGCVSAWQGSGAPGQQGSRAWSQWCSGRTGGAAVQRCAGRNDGMPCILPSLGAT